MILLLCVSGCGRHDNTDTGLRDTIIEEPEKMIIEETFPAETSSTEISSDNIRMNLLSYDNNEYPNDKVIVSVKPTEAIYLGGGDGGYVPVNQADWENAINTVTARLQSKDQRDPWEMFLPIYVSWIHGEYEDVWQLCEDGSLWGCHDYEAGIRTDNYIAPEDATELVCLLKEAYNELSINPVSLEQIRQAKEAELIIDGKSYYCDNQEELSIITDDLSQGERIRSSRCFWHLLRLTLENGEKLEIALAGDGCDIWHSDGIYWRFKNGGVAEILEIFKVNEEHSD